MHRFKLSYLCYNYLLIFLLFLLIPDKLFALTYYDAGYDDDGFLPNRSYVAFTPDEFLNPYSGNLIIKNTDIMLPGNAGMDLEISRVYNSKQIYVPPLSSWIPKEGAFGMGWEFFFSRIIPYGQNYLPAAELAMSDGSVYQIYENNHSNIDSNVSHDYIAENFAVLNHDELKDTWVMTQKDGTVYEFDQQVNVLGSPAGVHYYPSVIEDPNGNVIKIEYYNCCDISNPSVGGKIGSCSEEVNGLTKIPHISQVKDSAGRVIRFNWLNDSCRSQQTPNVISSIEVNDKEYRYEYTPVYDEGTEKIRSYLLVEVVPPVGPGWEYKYEWNENLPNGELRSLKYPQGATSEFQFETMQLEPEDHQNHFRNTIPLLTRVLKSRSISGPSIQKGKWNMNYGFDNGINVTEIDSPCGSIDKYYFHTALKNSFKGKWAVSLLYKKETLNYDKEVMQTNSRSWSAYKLSNNYNIPDQGFYYPLLNNESINRDGTKYSTIYQYNNFYALPTNISENRGTNEQFSRNINIKYFESIDDGKYIVGKPQTKVVTIGSDVKKTINKFDNETGNKVLQNRFGVKTLFSYHTDGNLKWIKNARDVYTHFSDYLYSLPEEINHGASSNDGSDSVYSVSRTVNWMGKITSMVNGKGNKTTYNYDGLGRLVKVNPPEDGSPDTTLSFNNSTGRSLSLKYGNSELIYRFDGFGRLIETLSNTGTRKVINYDQCGRVVYRSRPFKDQISNNGDRYLYDSLGRVTRVIHSDSSSIDYSYNANSVTVNNERDINTLYTYRSFGSPGDKKLVGIKDAAGNVTGYIYDVFGNINKVIQPRGIERKYNYNSKNFLVSEKTPERGKIKYKHDKIGNVISRRNADGEVISYKYDKLNRIVKTDHPGDEPDVTYNYDRANNLTSISSSNNSYIYKYKYDPSDRLISKNVMLDGGSIDYTIDYNYNDEGNINKINYPSGETVGYYFDAANRIISIVDGFDNFYLGNIAYHTSGFPLRYDTAYGVRSEFRYDKRDRLRSIKVSRPYPELRVIKKGLGNGTVRSVNIIGIDCGNDCGQVYPSTGTMVTLNAKEDKDSNFINWSGDPECHSSDRQISVVMNSNKTCVANFSQNNPEQKLSIIKKGTGKGSVLSTPEGITCGNDCEENYYFNTEVLIKGIAGPDSSFEKWSGDRDCDDGRVIMDSDKDCVAWFNLSYDQQFKIKVTKAGDGEGRVESTPAGIDCGTDCEQIYYKGEEVKFVTKPGEGSEFIGWKGNKDCLNGEIRVDANISCIAMFNSVQESSFMLSVNKTGSGNGHISSDLPGIDCGNDCSEEYKKNTKLILNAVPGNDSIFNGWEGNDDCIDGVLKVDKDLQCTASFDSTGPKEFGLEITKSGEGEGQVISSPDGISCGENCNHKFEINTRINLQVKTDEYSEFVRWTGDSDCTDGLITINKDTVCNAIIEPLPQVEGHTLEVEVLGPGIGTITSNIEGILCGEDSNGIYENCEHRFPEGEIVKLIPTEGIDSSFSGWEGGDFDCVDSQVTMNSDIYCVTWFSSTTKETFELLIEREGNGFGYLTSDPAGIKCGADCTEEFSPYKHIMLNVSVSPGSEFIGWSGNDDCQDGLVSMTSDIECRPIIDIISYSLKPGITYDYDPRPNKLGWYDNELINVYENVEITFRCEDNSGSGMASCSDPVVVSTEGVHDITGIAEDNEGSISEIPVPVKIDKTEPQIEITNYEDYDVAKLEEVVPLSDGTAIATIIGDVSDNLSGPYRVLCSSSVFNAHRILFDDSQNSLREISNFGNSGIINGSRFECEVELSASPNVGGNDVYLRLYDKAGNISADGIRLIYYGYFDTLPPEIEVLSVLTDYCYDDVNDIVRLNDLSIILSVTDDLSGPDFDTEELDLSDFPIDTDIKCTDSGIHTSLCSGGGEEDADNVYPNSRTLRTFNSRSVQGAYSIADRNGNLATEPVNVELPPFEELPACP